MSWSWFDDSAFRTAPLFLHARQLAPLSVWTAVWAVCAVGLMAAAVTRSAVLLHIFGGVAWASFTALVVGVMWTDRVDNTVDLSPIAHALFFWLLAGPGVLLVPPLWSRCRR
jgi:hypothetical protein